MMSYYGTIAFRLTMAALIGMSIPYVISFFIQKEKRVANLVTLFAFALVGATAGVTGEMSRMPTVGYIVPAFLGLIGSVAIYWFGQDASKGLGVSLGAAAVSISLIAGYTLASEYRNVNDERREIRAICAGAYTNADLLRDPQAFKQFCHNMGELCDYAMSWNFGTDDERGGSGNLNKGDK